MRIVNVSSSTSSRSGHIHLQFQDGTAASCDLLVGADGVKSAVRACMLRQHAAQLRAGEQKGPASHDANEEAEEAMRAVLPLWSGMMSYRTTISSKALKQRWPGHRVLSKGHLVSYDNVIHFAVIA